MIRWIRSLEARLHRYVIGNLKIAGERHFLIGHRWGNPRRNRTFRPVYSIETDNVFWLDCVTTSDVIWVPFVVVIVNDALLVDGDGRGIGSCLGIGRGHQRDIQDVALAIRRALVDKVVGAAEDLDGRSRQRPTRSSSGPAR